MMHDREKSDSAIVAGKPTNKAERSAAESVEPRAETKGNVGQQSTRRTQSRISVSQLLARIRHSDRVSASLGSLAFVKPRPTVIYNNGFDSTREEAYFAIARYDEDGRGLASNCPKEVR